MKVEICKLDRNRNVDKLNISWLVQAIDNFSRISISEYESFDLGNASCIFSYYALAAEALNSSYATNYLFDEGILLKSRRSELKKLMKKGKNRSGSAENEDLEANRNPATLASMCRNIGLLEDYNESIRLTPFARLLYIDNKVLIEEYVFALLSKQWVKVDGVCKRPLLSAIYELSISGSNFLTNLSGTQEQQKEAAFQIARQVVGVEADDILLEKAKMDILRNHLLLSGLFSFTSDKTIILTKEGESILKAFKEKENSLPIYQSDEFYEFIGSVNNGVFVTVDCSNADIFKERYPNLVRIILNLKKISSMNTIDDIHQQIYYGAPGTGKSHIVKRHTEGESVVRTTFHPDSDYSTFVGCYKPTTKKVAMRDVTGKIIVENDGTQVTEDRIVYEFVNQAFLQAYIKAWKFYAEAAEGAEPKKQYLIIEEINRGNCAQIFGDLFQLLDRNGYGFSDYYIHADKDMQKHLSKAFNNIDIDESHRNAINSLYPKDGDIVAKVLSGEILLLPNNLYIWATMNTSDQSLFPIDSAFKRRWDWRFRPIVKGRDNSGKELDWKIKIGQKVCAWWDFLEKINAVIGTTTSSADKKLGFFFCKADDGIISTETFVSKVIFYLWNDVFKDYGFENSIFNDTDGSTLDFDRFYSAAADGNVVVQNDKVQLFLTNLGLTLVDVDSVDGNINNDGEVAENDGTAFEVVLDGERISEKTAIGKFLKVIEKVGIERVAQLGLQVSGNPIISRDKLAEDTPGGYGGSQKYINGYWFVTKFNNPTKRKFLMEIKEKLGVNIVVE